MSAKDGGKSKEGKPRGYGRGITSNGNKSTCTPGTKGAKGACEALGNDIFEHGQKGSADQMQNTYKAIIKYVGNTFGTNMSTELRNRIHFVIPAPMESATTLTKHKKDTAHRQKMHDRMQKARRAHLAVMMSDPTKFPLDIPKLEIEIDQADYEMETPLEISKSATGEDKTISHNAWKAHGVDSQNLVIHRGKVFELILGQCTQNLIDKMKYDKEYKRVTESNDPLLLYSLIERTVMTQTEQRNPFKTAFELKRELYQYEQGTMSNTDWYERFNTKVEIATALEIVFCDPCLLKHTLAKDSSFHGSNGTVPTLDSLSDQDHERLIQIAQERQLAHIFLSNSGKQHAHLKQSLEEDYTMGNDLYPTTRQEVLRVLDQFTKPVSINISHGTAFAQKNSKGKDTEENIGKGPKCTYCKRFNHIEDECHRKAYDEKKKKEEKAHESSQPPKSVKSDFSVSSKHSKKEAIVKAAKAFTTMLTEAVDGDLTESDTEEGGAHLQYAMGFQQYTFSSNDSLPVVSRAYSQAEHVHKQSTKGGSGLNLREVVLLDNQSTIDLFCNPGMVYNIRKAECPLKLQSNGGVMQLHHKATLEGYHSEVWFSTDAICNIIGLCKIKKQYRVTYDSEKSDEFIIHRGADKPDMAFGMHPCGLHYFDPSDEAFSFFVETVSGNKTHFSQRQLKGAEAARQLYAFCKYPSMNDFKWIVQSGTIVNNGVSLQDIAVAQQIWGNTLSIAALKGKTTKSDPPPVAADFVKVPQTILDVHRDVTISADVFFVNKIPFLLTISRHLAFTTVSHLEDQKMTTIFKHFRAVYKLYENRGFKINLLLVDGEFAALQALVHDMEQAPRVNLTSANEHVPEAERRIRVVKERVRASRHDLPFARLPKLLTIHMVMDCVKILNYFPTKGGLSISPRLLMTGVGLDSKKHFRVPFGNYCQVHEEDKPRNSMLPRTAGAICLGHSGNLQGGHKFLCLRSGRLIVRYNWTPLPMPDEVLDRVNLLGADQPEQLIFADRRGRTLGEIELPGVYPDPFNGEHTDEEARDDANEFELNEAPDDASTDDAPTVNAAPTVEMENAGVPTEEHTKGLEEHTEGLRRSSRIKFKPSAYTPSFKGKAYAVTQQEVLLHPNSHMESNLLQDYVEPNIMALIMTQLSMKKGLSLG
jgi:hypothetical protein